MAGSEAVLSRASRIGELNTNEASHIQLHLTANVKKEMMG